MIIVKFLQLRGRRQIAESRKYCLVRVIFLFWRVFSLFLFLTGWKFGLIPYNIYVQGPWRHYCDHLRSISCYVGYSQGPKFIYLSQRQG